jgi:hypothetical protein
MMPRVFACLPLLCLACSVALVSAQTPLRDVIDQRIAAKWQEKNVTPAPAADDATFLRRIYLDICGTIPTADEAKAFLDDAAADKRTKLIDRLLEDPRYAQHQADEWDMIYFGRNPPGYDSDKRAGFQRWLREQFAQNTPYDKIARSILKAEGNTAEQGTPMFLVQYREQPEDATVKITQTFLGVQLQCARCHDHPYETWTQLDFYGMAAFLARLQTVEAGEVNKQKKIFLGEKNLGEIKFTGPASEAEPGKKGEPVPPKFLLGEKLTEPEPPKDAKDERLKDGQEPPKPQFSRKDKLAEWITAKENPYFARAIANRIWAQYMGRGLVHPVDNLSESNKPSHPELLQEITDQIVHHEFDLKWLIREIVNSKAYQLAATGDVAEERPQWFERARTRPLSAEEMAEAWRTAVNFVAVDPKAKEQLEKGERYYPMGEYQGKFLGSPTDGVGNFLGGISEQLFFNNGGIDRLFDHREGGLLHELSDKKNESPFEGRVERMYLAILSRRPSPEETQKFVEYLNVAEKDRIAERTREAMWALMTSSEFRFNH